MAQNLFSENLLGEGVRVDRPPGEKGKTAAGAFVATMTAPVLLERVVEHYEGVDE